MEIRPINVHDDREVEQWWSVSKAADAFGREDWTTFWSLRFTKVAFRADNNATKQVPLAAFEGNRLVGSERLHYPLLDNTHLGYVEPHVLPDHRRRGIGTALLETSLGRLRDLGRTSAVCEINLPLTADAEAPGLHFARKHGFELGILDVHRVLPLPVGPAELTALEAATQGHHEDFELVTWEDIVPDAYLEGYCDLQRAFNSQAPSGELDLEDEVWDEARVRNAEERFRKQGRRESVTVAIDKRGDVVGLTELMTTLETQEFAWQGGTLVLESARGHRLGMAMKLANLRNFQQMMPTCRAVHSWNAEENGPMVAINDALGFRPVERLAEMQLRL